MAHPDSPVLQEGSRGPEGACGSQPLAWGIMDQAVSMPQDVQCDQPSTRAALSTPSVQGIRPGGPHAAPPLPPPPPCDSRCAPRQIGKRRSPAVR